MIIALDAFGGDNAPLEILKGAEAAVKEYGVSIALTGDEATIKKCAEENNIDLSGMEIVQSDVNIRIISCLLRSYKIVKNSFFRTV
mgnify:CR=1 FL=1